MVNELNETIYSNSKFSSNLGTGEEYSDLKSEHHYLNDSINSTVLKKNTKKETPKGDLESQHVKKIKTVFLKIFY